MQAEGLGFSCASQQLKRRKGDWKVEIRDADGKVLQDVKFKVE
jgi:hypothetical protein